MNEKDDLVYLGHIIDAINRIKEYTNGMKKEDFLKDRKTQDAVIREITIIGEATTLISDLFKEDEEHDRRINQMYNSISNMYKK